jgi:hypothetical protein
MYLIFIVEDTKILLQHGTKIIAYKQPFPTDDTQNWFHLATSRELKKVRLSLCLIKH